MAKRYLVIWFDAQNGERRGSSSDLDLAIALFRGMGPHDWTRGIVKLGNRIVHRETRASQVRRAA